MGHLNVGPMVVATVVVVKGVPLARLPWTGESRSADVVILYSVHIGGGGMVVGWMIIS